VNLTIRSIAGMPDIGRNVPSLPGKEEIGKTSILSFVVNFFT